MQTTYFDILMKIFLLPDKKVISTSRVSSLNLISSYLQAFRKKGLKNLEWAKGPKEDAKQDSILNRTLSLKTIKTTLLRRIPNRTLTSRILKRTL